MEAESHIITARIDWQGITLSVTYDPDWLSLGATAHLEIRSANGQPLPVTATGYRSHFLHPDHIAVAGGPVAYALAWLEREATAPEWRRHVAATRQLSLL